MREDSIVIIRGSLQFREDEAPKIIADSIEDINEVKNEAKRVDRTSPSDDFIRVELPGRQAWQAWLLLR